MFLSPTTYITYRWSYGTVTSIFSIQYDRFCVFNSFQFHLGTIFDILEALQSKCQDALYLISSASYQLVLHVGEIRVLYLYHCLQYGQFCVFDPTSAPFGAHCRHFLCLAVKLICQNSLYLDLSAVYRLVLHVNEFRTFYLHYCFQYGRFCIFDPHSSPFGALFDSFDDLHSK